MTAAELDYTFRAMGSDIRLVIGDRLRAAAPEPLHAADREREFIRRFSDRLSRFRSDSELSALNRDPRWCVPASALLRAAVTAAVWAAEHSGGLVDPTLVGALERCGYDHSLDGEAPASLAEALAVAPARRPARPHPAARWRAIRVDEEAGTITRPPGVMIDTGGTGKGLCADAVALRLAGYARFAVDCGGDVAIGGIGAQLHPYEVVVEHPLTLAPIGAIAVARGGIATSGLNVRIWRGADGGYAHHLLDPSSGRPVWSGLVGATALGADALEAETLSKMALLLGPAGAREVLAQRGGVVVHDDGSVEAIGPVAGSLKPAAAPAEAVTPG
ncbi:MAG TPA: FAD:protein FMN transferase [Solirubrobacteraceae bacterium]|nr:FAD:protein FMN transferase [Solirubrobacteraceae bacterium]